jgi:hypothetical protein
MPEYIKGENFIQQFFDEYVSRGMLVHANSAHQY